MTSNTKASAISKLRAKTLREDRLYQIIKSSYSTEKSEIQAENDSRQITFRVLDDANKFEISQAVSKLFNVVVKKVRTLKKPARSTNFKQKSGKRAGFKKAIVSLEAGHDINIADFS